VQELIDHLLLLTSFLLTRFLFLLPFSFGPLLTLTLTLKRIKTNPNQQFIQRRSRRIAGKRKRSYRGFEDSEDEEGEEEGEEEEEEEGEEGEWPRPISVQISKKPRRERTGSPDLPARHSSLSQSASHTHKYVTRNQDGTLPRKSTLHYDIDDHSEQGRGGQGGDMKKKKKKKKKERAKGKGKGKEKLPSQVNVPSSRQPLSLPQQPIKYFTRNTRMLQSAHGLPLDEVKVEENDFSHSKRSFHDPSHEKRAPKESGVLHATSDPKASFLLSMLRD